MRELNEINCKNKRRRKKKNSLFFKEHVYFAYGEFNPLLHSGGLSNTFVFLSFWLALKWTFFLSFRLYFFFCFLVLFSINHQNKYGIWGKLLYRCVHMGGFLWCLCSLSVRFFFIAFRAHSKMVCTFSFVSFSFKRVLYVTHTICIWVWWARKLTN